jgi:hypothetical protein
MLSLQRYREILGDDCPKSDAELELLVDQMRGLASVICDAFVEDRKRRKDARHASTNGEIRAIVGGDGVGDAQQPVGFQDAVAMLPDDERADIEERAAIAEVDGGLDRDTAERAAFSDLWRRKHKRRGA